jgi:nicotinate-nucleotide adenylyltransferase
MILVKPPSLSIARLGILSGSFHPPTRAHLALAQAALEVVDAVLWTLPRQFPHKSYEGTSLEQRMEMLRLVTLNEPRFLLGVSEGGLLIEIARECQPLFPDARLSFLCGRDAAERFVSWNYMEGQSWLEMLNEFELLVAPREGQYKVPPEMRHAIYPLAVDHEWDDVSSTEVRRRIHSGEPWEYLVPAEAVEMVRKLYS